MRLTFVNYHLAVGGAERILALMANYWAERGHRISIVTLDDGTAAPFFVLHETIRRHPLGIAGISSNPVYATWNNAQRLRRLRRAIKDTTPELVISFVDQMNVLTLLAMLGLDIPVVVTEHIDPFSAPLNKSWEMLRYLLYPRSTCITVLDARSAEYFPSKIRSKVRVLPNPVTLPARARAGTQASRDKESKTIVAMGKLHPQKGFDLLLRAFAMLAPNYLEWHLEIWGEGPARHELETLRQHLGLYTQASLPGNTAGPYEAMQRASLFVLSSRFEGFPTVLGEAMACGLPVISFACPTGPDQLIRDGIDGRLVPPGDVVALAAAMEALMRDESERQRLAARGPEVLERFSLDRIMQRWEGLIEEIVGRDTLGPPLQL